MEASVQTEPDTSDKNIKDKASTDDEHVSKKLKLSEPVDKDLKLDTDISNKESNDIEMPLAQENEPKPGSSKQKTPDRESKKPSTSHSSKSSKKEQASGKKDNDSDDDGVNVVHHEPTPGFKYPLEADASDMMDEADNIVDGRLPTVTERYFTPYYQLDITKPGDDVCVLVHSNRICMFTLAPSHIIYQENKKIVKCDYQVSEKLNRLKNKVSGKAKHGAQPLQNNSNLCRLTCDDGSVHVVKCCIIGKLVEVNERLVQDPELLKKAPHQGGYIAVALPNLKHLDRIKSNLLDQTRYEEALKVRKEKIDKEKSEKSGDTLPLEEKNETSEKKNEENNHEQSVESKETKEIINVNESETKVDDMEVVES